MTVGSVTGAHQSIRPVPLSGASAQVVSSSHKDMTSGEAATGKSRPEQLASLSKTGESTPSTKVTLSHTSGKDQPTQPLTYHKVYRSQPFNTPDPNTVKYELVKDKPGDSHSKDGEVSASEKTKGKDSVKSDKSDKSDKSEDPGKLKALAYGAIGVDADGAKEKESGYYNAGQFLKAVGTIGGLVALIV
ncbi:MAG: hypothetical protein CENE_03577 [Candidatus Celerinatantimonas neptuna]|nr:MAG: hypothetical protein CENE_03577 [Candidatus Celerinatantimonas neptuna]